MIATKKLKSLVAPAKVGDKTYDDLVKVLKEHYSQKINTIAERYRFNKCSQECEQSISDFSVMLKTLAENCQFGAFKEEPLRDRFVVGIKDNRLRSKLLAKGDRTFTSAIEIASTFELVEHETQEMAPGTILAIKSHPHKGKQAVPQYTSEKTKQRCHRCGRNHNASSCPAREWKCFVCQRVGHTSRTCRSRGAGSSTRRGKHQSVNQVTEEDVETGVQELQLEAKYFVNMIQQHSNGPAHICVEQQRVCTLQDQLPVTAINPPLMMSLQIDGREQSFEVDCGACTSIVSHAKKKNVKLWESSR
ncbi:uncharacterized protein LOC129720942 isoform X2 [Wyeomyia smithii]|uniref:uncharacterized protein LOC129720942 isoform X2 n=1 Tax=Wyeomyia smithii TaxID=174621 RepID=UPI002467F821|nr:uncharacterized protein LOC129720942 isoform X2 [Wyeomyia smithii]